MSLFSVVIPTWNGIDLLKKNLRKVLETVPKGTEVIIVDNGSTDGSSIWLRQEYPQVKTFEIKKNIGFGPACNFGFTRASGELVVLLNNDVVPEKGFLSSIEKMFANPDVFAVSLNEPTGSWATGREEAGFLRHSPGKKTDKKHLSLWASGGSAVFRRSYWREVGGFDRLYHPFYWEDTDLGLRAWQRGWQIWWTPEAIVHHRHESTIGRLPKKYVDRVRGRNELIFSWRHLVDRHNFVPHLKVLLKRVVAHPGYLKVVGLAILKLPLVLKRRSQEKGLIKIGVKEVLEKVTK